MKNLSIVFSLSVLLLISLPAVALGASPFTMAEQNRLELRLHEELIAENRQRIEDQKKEIIAIKEIIEELPDASVMPAPVGEYLYAAGEPAGKIVGYDANTLRLETNASFDAVKIWANGKISNRGQLLFTETDCRGEAYINIEFEEGREGYLAFRLTNAKGRIFVCDFGKCEASIYYLSPKEKFFYGATILSVYRDGWCTNMTNSNAWLYHKLHINKPEITGISEYPLRLPLTSDGMEEMLMTQGN